MNSNANIKALAKNLCHPTNLDRHRILDDEVEEICRDTRYILLQHAMEGGKLKAILELKGHKYDAASNTLNYLSKRGVISRTAYSFLYALTDEVRNFLERDDTIYMTKP